MINGISDEAFDGIVNRHWEQMAFTAYDGYRKTGRGALYIEKTSGGDSPEDMTFNFQYAAFDYNAGMPDPNAAKLISEYDPAREIVLMYLRLDGRVRCARVGTAPGARHPGRIHFFETLMQEDPDNRDNPDHWKDRNRDETIRSIISLREERGW